jgi:uncharacterized protein involved in exopolysaccharide biosynthesis
MGAIMSGIVAAIAIGVVAAIILSEVQKPAYEAYSTASTRLSDPGSNLVGETWSGNPTVQHNGS